MPTNSLTDAKCKTAKAAEKPYKLFDGHGLYLAVSVAGGKHWRVSYRLDGKPQTATIGPYPLIGLADARIKRDELRRKLLEGQPLKAPKVRKGLTLREASEAYWSGRKDLSADYLMNAENALERHIMPKLRSKQLAELQRTDVLDALTTMDSNGLHSYVRKTRGWLSQVFDWAVEQNHMPLNLCSTIRPEKAFGKVQVESFAALELPEVRPFLQRLDMEGVIQSAQACRLLALTWVRTKELRFMKFDQIDGDLWRIPAAVMKRRRDHLVPLSAQALVILDNMRKRARSEYVFPNDRVASRPMSENAVQYLILRMGYKDRMTGHGWRSVASTWANERGYNTDAIERQLAHVPDDKVRAVYNRAEYITERRQMLQDWADWLYPPKAAKI